MLCRFFLQWPVRGASLFNDFILNHISTDNYEDNNWNQTGIPR